MPRPLLAPLTSVRAALLVASFVTAAAACAHQDSGEVIGSSHTAIDAPPEHGDGGPAASDPQLPAGWREQFPKLATLAVSRGHGTGTWPATVHADLAGAKALAGQEDAAGGSTLVEIHPSKRGELLFIMQKSDGADAGSGARWHYRVRDGEGVTLDPPACEGCHGQAPHDHLFLLAPDPGKTGK